MDHMACIYLFIFLQVDSMAHIYLFIFFQANPMLFIYLFIFFQADLVPTIYLFIFPGSLTLTIYLFIFFQDAQGEPFIYLFVPIYFFLFSFLSFPEPILSCYSCT